MPPSIALQGAMVKIGRNDLCPCGSGKKYKKCCLGKALPTHTQPQHAHTGDERAQALAQAEKELYEDSLRLDDLSNSVVDLIAQKRLDEALAACEQLHHDYPEVIDWLERFAMVHEARGDWSLAADYYRRALAFTEQPEQRDGFDDDGRAYYRKKLAETEARAAARGPAPTST
jgi:tetratricopeptide (TPR) repeat protein